MSVAEPPASGEGLGPARRLGRWVGQILPPVRRSQGSTDQWALWKAACADDHASATRLVRLLTPQAYALAMQLLARREDAEDVVQDAFLRLWRSRPSDARGATLATFFNTIVINRCKSALVRRRELGTAPEQLTELSDARQLNESPETDTAHAINPVQLQSAMARLPPRQRMALAMWAYADADVPEIARALELDGNAAHQLLHRAKTALRNLLREHAP